MSAESLDAPATVAMLRAAARAIIAAEPVLTDADRKLGDGDHGVGMERGMTAGLEKLDEGGDLGVGPAFSTLGMAMMSSMGGASGALFGTFFRSAGKAIGDREALDSKALADALAAGAEGVTARGGAKPGDKTMVDAIEPARAAAEAARGEPVTDALEKVAAAAEAGREASRDMIATMGRAKTLGEKSVGHPDAGACSVAIILRAMADTAAAP